MSLHAEADIVALLRQRREFDPDLSLVAEIDGGIAGHALFFPYTMRLLGSDVPVVSLAPIGVLPSHQRQGIGGRLIREGHRIATAKGYVLSFLLGHVSYYPCFGYRTNAFGSAEVTIKTVSLPEPVLNERSPTMGDVPALHGLWPRDEAEVDFALDPGHDLLDWVSPNPVGASFVHEQGGNVVGYTRLLLQEPARPRVFLAADSGVARLVAAAIASRAQTPEIVLPIHTLSGSAAAFSTPSVRPLPAAMVAPLAPSRLLDYFAMVESGERPVGRITWPVAFNM